MLARIVRISRILKEEFAFGAAQREKDAIDKAESEEILPKPQSDSESQSFFCEQRNSTQHIDSEKILASTLELADESTDLDVWVDSFNLARVLRKFSQNDPDQFEFAVSAYCEKTGHDFD